MLTKKAIAIAGASFLAIALLTGVTYAWFTNTQIATPGTIEAGYLGMEFEVTDLPTEAIPIYPRTAPLAYGTDNPYTGEAIPDVAQVDFKLTNDSSRAVLVRVGVPGLEVMGSEVDEDDFNNIIPGTEGTVEITDISALIFRYHSVNEAIANTKIGNDLFLYLPQDKVENEYVVQVWIDGAESGNEYQHATINLGNVTATAVQFNSDAIQDAFSDLTPEDLIEIEALGGSFDY